MFHGGIRPLQWCDGGECDIFGADAKSGESGYVLCGAHGDGSGRRAHVLHRCLHASRQPVARLSDANDGIKGDAADAIFTVRVMAQQPTVGVRDGFEILDAAVLVDGTVDLLIDCRVQADLIVFGIGKRSSETFKLSRVDVDVILQPMRTDVSTLVFDAQKIDLHGLDVTSAIDQIEE